MSKYIYPYSKESAKEDGHLDLWHASHAENIACAKAIDAEIELDIVRLIIRKNSIVVVLMLADCCHF